MLELEVWQRQQPAFSAPTCRTLGRGRAASSGRVRGRPPAPDYNPELAAAPLGRPRRQARSRSWDRECGAQGSGHRGTPSSRPGVPDQVRLWQEVHGLEGTGACPSWTMAPSRDVVKIAVQMRDAIPQLIQLDQVTQPVRPKSTPPPTSGSPPSYWNSPPHPSPQVLPRLLLLAL